MCIVEPNNSCDTNVMVCNIMRMDVLARKLQMVYRAKTSKYEREIEEQV